MDDITVFIHDAGFVEGQIHDPLEQWTNVVEVFRLDYDFFHKWSPHITNIA